MGLIADNLAAVQAKITSACTEAGRELSEVRLIAVSKTHPVELIGEAYAAGARLFGENKVQEASDKADALSDVPDLRWAVIGHLQTNKAKQVAQFASEFHALDSAKVAEALDRRLDNLGRDLDVFIQVNASGEESKFGLDPEDVPQFAKSLGQYRNLNVRGLMTLAVFSDDQAAVGACFATMQRLQTELRDIDSLPGSYDELSMGMSGDYELAIAHGATTVRVGQAIFGARLDPNAYWAGEQR